MSTSLKNVKDNAEVILNEMNEILKKHGLESFSVQEMHLVKGKKIKSNCTMKDVCRRVPIEGTNKFKIVCSRELVCDE